MKKTVKRVATVFIMFFVLIGGSALIPNKTNAADSDFIIKDGVLMEYLGNDNHVTIPMGVTKIGSHAFMWGNMKSITIPNSVTEIDYGAFLGSNLTSITIPDGIKEIKYDTFRMCENLIEVKMPNSVTKIGSESFSCCENLENILIPDSVTEIDYGAFFDCGLISINLPKNLSEISKHLFEGCHHLTNVIIPDGITKIDDEAFEYCDSLTSIVLPNSITEIGNYAFSNASSLTNITIPSTVKEIGGYAFEGTPWLDKKRGERKDHLAIINNNILIDGQKVENNIIIPDEIMMISDSAFKDCKNLTNITIPSTVKEIGNYAFEGTPWLDKKRGENTNNLVIINNVLIDGRKAGNVVTIPKGITKINSRAFEYDSDYEYDCLTNIIIPEELTKIGDYAFANCYSLNDIILPDTIEKIGDYAFYGTSITKITIPKSTESIGWCTFYYCDELKEITILNPHITLDHIFDNIDSQQGPGLQEVPYAKPVFNNNDLVIKGYKNSTAETLADYLDKHKEIYAFNSVTFVPIDDTSSTVAPSTGSSISPMITASPTPQPIRTSSPVIFPPVIQTPIPTVTPVPSPTPIPTATPTPTITAQPSQTPVATVTPVASADVPDSTVKPVNTVKPENTQTPTAAPTAKPTKEPASTSRPLSTIQKNKALFKKMKVSKKLSIKKGKSKKVKLSFPDDVTVVKKFSGKDGEVQVKYYTSDTGVATINKKGKIKAKKKGSVDITTVVTFENKMSKAFSTKVKVKKNKKAIKSVKESSI